MQKQIDSKLGYAIIAGATAIFLVVMLIGFKMAISPFNKEKIKNLPSKPGQKNSINESVKEKIVKFSSLEDFKKYLNEAGDKGLTYFGRGGGMPETLDDMAVLGSENTGQATVMRKSTAPAPQVAPGSPRYSETNVQVLGIDEPDAVKTDGQQIYFSQSPRFYPMVERRTFSPVPSDEVAIIPPDPGDFGKIKLIDALPPNSAKVAADIEKNGELLLYKDTLMVFSDFKRKIYGYDVGNSSSPQEKWTVEIKDRDEIVGARLYGDKVFLITRSYFSYESPCPFEPVVLNGNALKISCTDIYHPVEPVPVDITYTIVSFNAKTGQLEESASFVGSSSKSVLYMSGESIYLTYEYPGDQTTIIADFFGENQDLIPVSITDKIKKISDYDLSKNAKDAELNSIVDKYTRGLSRDDLMRIRNEFSNRLDKFMSKKARELEFTGIVKIAVPNLTLEASGKVTGSPLNQFSLDEYQGNLRIATTFTGSIWLPGGLGGVSRGNQGASDVYVLNDNLDVIGSAQNLGVGERIYSVRFIENKGYVVTFKQIDPFFVLDLSNPRRPEVKGELKIPGFSSYLHPLDDNKILGVGQEEGKVKLTVFDVTSPENPRELDTYRLDDYWTEVSNNHHAFLLDKQHGIFFLPGGNGGYVFSYADGRLSLKKTISESGVKRAVYIGDYLYILSDSKMTVLSENDWEKVKELEL